MLQFLSYLKIALQKQTVRKTLNTSMVNLEISTLLQDLNLGHIFEQQIEDFIEVDFRLRSLSGIEQTVLVDFHGYQHFFRNETVLKGSNYLKRKLLEGLGYFYLEIWVTDWNLKQIISEKYTDSQIKQFQEMYPGVKEEDLGSGIFLLELIEGDFARRYPKHANLKAKQGASSTMEVRMSQIFEEQQEHSDEQTKKFFSEDEDDFDSQAVFDATITYCSECGYESRAKYISDVIKSVYPGSDIKIVKTEEQNGAFEVEISHNGKSTKVHSKLNGDGFITEQNVYEFMLDIEDELSTVA